MKTQKGWVMINAKTKDAFGASFTYTKPTVDPKSKRVWAEATLTYEVPEKTITITESEFIKRMDECGFDIIDSRDTRAIFKHFFEKEYQDE